MAIALAFFGVAFAAFCVWLTVRLVNRRERWAKWTAAVLVVVLTAYPLSIGPVIWLSRSGWIPESAGRPLAYLYAPLNFVELIPKIGPLFEWYMERWIPTPKEPVIFDAIDVPSDF